MNHRQRRAGAKFGRSGSSKAVTADRLEMGVKHHQAGQLPEAEEVISYKIPTYKLHGSRILYFAGWRKFYSIYPATDTVLAAFKADLAPYEINKHTIRFPLSQPVPVKLIGRIAKFRAMEVRERSNRGA